MKRIVDPYLTEWKESPYRKPLLLRGARQIGKTHAVRHLGKQFESFVEVNFESDQTEIKDIFDRDLDPTGIIRDISFILKKISYQEKRYSFLTKFKAYLKR